MSFSVCQSFELIVKYTSCTIESSKNGAVRSWALAAIGICTVGVFVAAMAIATRARELLLPVLFLPLAIPVIVGGVGASVAEAPGRYLGFLALYDALFATICWASFEYVVTE